MKHLLILLLGVFLFQPTYAHIKMISPLPRLDVDNLKQGPGVVNPCGNQPRGTNPYVYEPNQIVPIVFQETINHPGRFIVQFSMANDTGFALPENELTRLEDTMAGGMRTLQARMPNVECNQCTLRVIQVMDDQPGELYVHCIDINLRAAAAPPPPPPPVTPPPPGPGALGSDTAATATKPGFGCGLVSDNSSGSGPGSAGGVMRWALVLMMLPLVALTILRQRVRASVRSFRRK
jgi:hypothetical protein